MRLSRWQTWPLLWLAPSLFPPSFATSSAAISLPSCTPQNSIPIHYPIRNVTLSDGTLRRGVAVSLGTPWQRFAFILAPCVPFTPNTQLGMIHLINLGDKTTRISMTVPSPAAVLIIRGCSAPTNTVACSTRGVQPPGLQQIFPH